MIVLLEGWFGAGIYNICFIPVRLIVAGCFMCFLFPMDGMRVVAAWMSRWK